MVDEYVLTLTNADLSVISNALLEMPYRMSAPVIGKIGAQLAASDAANATKDDPANGSDEP